MAELDPSSMGAPASWSAATPLDRRAAGFATNRFPAHRLGRPGDSFKGVAEEGAESSLRLAPALLVSAGGGFAVDGGRTHVEGLLVPCVGSYPDDRHLPLSG